MILAGVEVRRFGLEAEVAALCRRLDVPVVATFMSRGLFVGMDVPLRGTFMGVAGDPALTRLVEGADALFMPGVIVSDTNFGVSRKQVDIRHAMLACDGRVSIGYEQFPDLPLPVLIRSLNEKCKKAVTGTYTGRNSYPRGLIADDAPVTPTDIATAAPCPVTWKDSDRNRCRVWGNLRTIIYSEPVTVRISLFLPAASC